MKKSNNLIKFKQSKGFLLRDIIVSALFGMGVIALFVIVIGSMATNYNRSDLVSPSFSANYNKLNSLLTDLETSRVAVTSPQGLSFIGTFNVAFNSIFTVFKLVLNSIDMFGSMAASVVSDYSFLDAGVIKILMGILLAGLLVITLFVWISSVTRGRI
jgi:hypothetical protein